MSLYTASLIIPSAVTSRKYTRKVLFGTKTNILVSCSKYQPHNMEFQEESMPPPPHRGSVEILRGSRVAKKFLKSSMELNLNFWRGRAVQTEKKKISVRGIWTFSGTTQSIKFTTVCFSSNGPFLNSLQPNLQSNSSSTLCGH